MVVELALARERLLVVMKHAVDLRHVLAVDSVMLGVAAVRRGGFRTCRQARHSRSSCQQVGGMVSIRTFKISHLLHNKICSVPAAVFAEAWFVEQEELPTRNQILRSVVTTGQEAVKICDRRDSGYWHRQQNLVASFID